jgi:hypothetical protein
LERIVFDSLKEPKIIKHRGPERQTYGYFHDLVQGKRTRNEYRDGEYEKAVADLDKLYAKVLQRRSRLRKAGIALAGTALATTLVTGGFEAVTHLGSSDVNNSQAEKPALTASPSPIKPTTPSLTPTPKPLPPYTVVPGVALGPKPAPSSRPHATRKTEHPHPTSETSAPTYTPPENTYTPPPAPPTPHHSPHLIVHPLHEH